MVRVLCLSLIVSLSLSLIWWPGAKNESLIFDLIEKERIWQADNLGFDIVSTVDKTTSELITFLSTSPIPRGPDSTLPYSISSADSEIQAAVARVTQQPYWQAMFALIVLAIGRLLVTTHIAIALFPLLIPVIIDALSAREIQHVLFKASDSFQFRLATCSLFILIEIFLVISMFPIWINPDLILAGFILLGVALHRTVKHYYR